MKMCREPAPVAARADQTLHLDVATTGFEEGTPAAFATFYAGAEEPGEEIALLETETDADGVLSVEWKYEPRAHDRGTVPLVFRCEIEGMWITSGRIEIEVPTLLDVDFDRESAAVGDTLKITATGRGMPPDAKVEIAVRSAENNAELDAFEVPFGSGTAVTTWTVPDDTPVYCEATYGELALSSYPIAVEESDLGDR